LYGLEFYILLLDVDLILEGGLYFIHFD